MNWYVTLDDLGKVNRIWSTEATVAPNLDRILGPWPARPGKKQIKKAVRDWKGVRSGSIIKAENVGRGYAMLGEDLTTAPAKDQEPLVAVIG